MTDDMRAEFLYLKKGGRRVYTVGSEDLSGSYMRVLIPFTHTELKHSHKTDRYGFYDIKRTKDKDGQIIKGASPHADRGNFMIPRVRGHIVIVAKRNLTSKASVRR